LSDVIAAILAMGAYKFYKLSFEDRADRIEGDKDKAEHWRKVFSDRPDFLGWMPGETMRSWWSDGKNRNVSALMSASN